MMLYSRRPCHQRVTGRLRTCHIHKASNEATMRLSSVIRRTFRSQPQVRWNMKRGRGRQGLPDWSLGGIQLSMRSRRGGCICKGLSMCIMTFHDGSRSVMQAQDYDDVGFMSRFCDIKRIPPTFLKSFPYVTSGRRIVSWSEIGIGGFYGWIVSSAIHEIYTPQTVTPSPTTTPAKHPA